MQQRCHKLQAERREMRHLRAHQLARMKQLKAEKTDAGRAAKVGPTMKAFQAHIDWLTSRATYAEDALLSALASSDAPPSPLAAPAVIPPAEEMETGGSGNTVISLSALSEARQREFAEKAARAERTGSDASAGKAKGKAD